MKYFFAKSKFLILMAGLIISACSAYDLGSDGNWYFDIGKENIANPVWDPGIKDIVEKKCASCHTDSSPWYKPKNTDTNQHAEKLKRIATRDFWEQDAPILTLVKQCLESVCGVEQVPMPPKYATPLSADEKQAIINFLTPLLPKAAVGFTSSWAQCIGCHGDKGQGGGFPKLSATQLTQEQFISKVRSGGGSMPPYDASKYSDADLKKDYDYLKTLP